MPGKQSAPILPMEPGQPNGWRRWWAPAGALLIAVTAGWAYSPSLSGGFIFDDDLLLTNNALIHAHDGLLRFWVTTQQPDYVPLTSSTLWLEWRLWGMNPTGYHVANLILHIAACWLIWLLLHRLSISGAFLAALLYAVHPVNVESVAWVEQRKDTLSMVFFLLSILWYVRDEQDRNAHAEGATGTKGIFNTGRWYWLSMLAFVLAMFSKGSVAILPLELLLVIWWLRGRIMRQDLLRCAPFFVVAAVLTPVIIWFVTHGANVELRHATFVERLLGAGTVIWFYLSKALAPIYLVFVYPLWHIQATDVLWWLPLMAAVILTAVLLWQRNSAQSSWVRALFFAWAFFCAALLPVLGFSDPGYMRFSLVADHYQHIALLSVASLIAAGWGVWHHRAQGVFRLVAMVSAVVLVGSLTFQTWRQNKHYKDAITLYEITLEQNPRSSMVHYNLALELFQAGFVQRAIEHYREAVALKPDYIDALNNLGIALSYVGQTRESLECFERSLQLQPDSAPSYNNLGRALIRAGRPQQALTYFEQALRIEPAFPEAQNNWGEALNNTNQPQMAIEHLQEALRLKPDFPEAHNNLGNARRQLGQLPAAIEQYQQAVQLKPDFSEALSSLGQALISTGHPQEAIKFYERSLQLKPDVPEARNNLGTALKQSGQLPAAIEQYQQALVIRPDFVEAHYNLANAFAMEGRTSEAIDQYQQAIQIKPDFADAHINLAGALVKAGRPEEAIQQFRQVLKLKPQDATIYANLAKIYGQLHRSEEAITAAQQALDMARSAGQTALAGQIEAWLTNYRQQQANPQNGTPEPSPVHPAP